MTRVIDTRRPMSEDDIGFPDGPSVDVREENDRQWSVLAAFEYQGFPDRFVVPTKELTDFASVPRPLVWFIPRYGRYTKAAILHDHLCRLAKEGRFERRDADAIFRQAMRTLNVAFLRRWIMWAAVRVGALAHASGRRGWLRDLPLVALIAVLVLPIVLPAAVLITLTLVVWFVVEVVVWIPLWLAKHLRQRFGVPAKRVNWPELTFRL